MDKINSLNLKIKNTPDISETEQSLAFEIRQYKDGIVVYIFKNLFVAIDTTGKNYKELPEILFGPYNKELDTWSLSKPEHSNNGLINMEYVAKCIQKVSKTTGVNKFFFHPFGDDVKPENADSRELARLRLFKIMSTKIEPTSDGRGYIITV